MSIEFVRTRRYTIGYSFVLVGSFGHACAIKQVMQYLFTRFIGIMDQHEVALLAYIQMQVSSLWQVASEEHRTYSPTSLAMQDVSNLFSDGIPNTW